MCIKIILCNTIRHRAVNFSTAAPYSPPQKSAVPLQVTQADVTVNFEALKSEGGATSLRLDISDPLGRYV